MRWDESDEMIHIVESIEIGDFKMKRHIPYIVFAQDPGTFEVLDDLICDTKAEADSEATEMDAEMSCYAEGMPDISIERLDSEKVQRVYGSAEQQRLLREFLQ